MPNELDPRIDQWYSSSGKGQRFYVTVIDGESGSVEVQHFDGDLEEFTIDEWRDLQIELSEEPENWSGSLDVTEKDDLGTEVTDTKAADWDEPGEDFRRPNK